MNTVVKSLLLCSCFIFVAIQAQAANDRFDGRDSHGSNHYNSPFDHFGSYHKNDFDWHDDHFSRERHRHDFGHHHPGHHEPQITAAPEPVSSALFLVGGGVLALGRIRRKKV